MFSKIKTALRLAARWRLSNQVTISYKFFSQFDVKKSWFSLMTASNFFLYQFLNGVKTFLESDRSELHLRVDLCLNVSLLPERRK